MTKSLAGLEILRIGQHLLKGFKEKIGEEEYNKIMKEPVKSCSCGFIKEGDYTLCPKCEGEKIRRRNEKSV
jgi:hypothetical protein